MTQREFLLAVANRQITDEVAEYAQVRVDRENERLEERNIARAENVAKTLEYFTREKDVSASELGKEIEVSTQMASTILRGLFEEGKLTRGKDKERDPFRYNLP